jgi:hypothetical protein
LLVVVLRDGELARQYARALHTEVERRMHHEADHILESSFTGLAAVFAAYFEVETGD